MSGPQLFTVDADGNGAGRIVSETGDVYEGSFESWNRHGFGVQRWSNGSVFRGSWDADQQAIGIFIDGTNGTRWKGDFRTGQVERLDDHQREEEEDQENADKDLQQHGADRRQEEKEDHAVTHFPASSSNYQAQQYDPLLAQTSRGDFTSTSSFSQTQQLPPHSARSARTMTAGHRVTPRPKPVKFQRRRETKAEREEREAREAKEEAIVLKELKQSVHLISKRFGSSRVPGEATFGLMPDSPGPGAYDVLLSHRRAAPRHSMAPRLPNQSEVALIVKTTASSGPWSSNVKPNNPSKPAIPAISIAHRSMLPAYVKESTFFHPETPGPGSHAQTLSAKGTPLDIANNSAPVADHGGHTIKGYPIPRYLGKEHMKHVNLGKGADGGLYTPKLDFVAGREKGPSFTMRPRYRDGVYHTLRLSQGPSPAAYTPSFSQVRADPIGIVSGWGRSRSGARPHPTESVQAVVYAGEKMLRNQLGLASPGPAAYSLPTSFQPPGLHPRPTAGAVFGPHLVQPPAIHLAEQFIQEKHHPFVDQWKKQYQGQTGGPQDDEANQDDDD